MDIDQKTLFYIVRGYLKDRSILSMLEVMYRRIGKLFEVPLPGFRAYFTGGPSANRQILVTERDSFYWRIPEDPVVDLLQRGVLVVDGDEHDTYRNLMTPFLTQARLAGYTNRMIRQVDRVTETWRSGQTIDMLIECRKIALLIIMDVLFSIDFWDDLPLLWTSILKAIKYISPGAWIIHPRIPRPGYRKYIKQLDKYLYEQIRIRREVPQIETHDLLSHLIDAGLDDSSIRDQMLTLLIAGHDTSTALLAWTFYLLGKNQLIYEKLQTDLDNSLPDDFLIKPSGWQPPLLDAVLKEALRLYPPIHLGNRRTTREIEINGVKIPAGRRLLYSIYLSHRDTDIWENADQFCPDRFLSRLHNPPFSFIPFGGGPRSCVGSAFGMVEARMVLARLLSQYKFQLIDQNIRPRMGATLEPSPGVLMKINRTGGLN